MSGRGEKYDLTQGDILKKLLLVAVPIMGTQLLQMSYNLADMFWLGRVGADAVAASGTAGMYMWLSAAFLMIGRMGAEIGVSQSFGRDDRDGAKHYAQNALFLAVVLGVTFGLVLVLFRRPLVGFFAIQEAHVARYAEDYLMLVAVAMPANFVASALIGCFNASGNARTPFLVTAIGLVLNMILDPLLIFGFGWGIAGAAIATSLSQFASCAVMIIAIKRAKNRPFERFQLFARPILAFIRRILGWSVPICAESMFFTFMAMITSRLVASFGTDAMAVSRVGSQIESLTWLLAGGYGSALTAFMGQNYGASKWRRIRRGFDISLRVMIVYGVLVTAVIYFFGGALFGIFLPDARIMAMGAEYLRIIAIAQVPQCLEAVAGSTFKGIGRTLPPSVVSMVSNILRVLMAYLFARTSMGLSGVWLGIALAAVLRGLWGLCWFLLSARKLPREDGETIALREGSAG